MRESGPIPSTSTSMATRLITQRVRAIAICWPLSRDLELTLSDSDIGAMLEDGQPEKRQAHLERTRSATNVPEKLDAAIRGERLQRRLPTSFIDIVLNRNHTQVLTDVQAGQLAVALYGADVLREYRSELQDVGLRPWAMPPSRRRRSRLHNQKNRDVWRLCLTCVPMSPNDKEITGEKTMHSMQNAVANREYRSVPITALPSQPRIPVSDLMPKASKNWPPVLSPKGFWPSTGTRTGEKQIRSCRLGTSTESGETGGTRKTSRPRGQADRRRGHRSTLR